MSNLSQEEKEAILDFYFRCGEEQDLNRAQNLIADNTQAAKFYAALKEILSRLENIKDEPCPDNLVELTVAKLESAASESKTKLQKLLEKEQKKTFQYKIKTSRQPHLTNILEVAAVAAVFLIITGLGFPLLSNIRQKSFQTTCQAKLRNIGDGLASYANDKKDPVPMTAGSPWWKVGQQGEENHSNTRHLWLLVKDNYVEPDKFICPGHKDAKPAIVNSALTTQYQDFPSRKNLSYSFRTNCHQAQKNTHKALIIIADRNPIFANIPQDSDHYKLDQFTKILLSEELKKMMSPNHNTKGQNILHCDGSVEFIHDRIVNGDDIYTIEGVDEYSGCEVPHNNNDIFLAP
jgi:hypothetical protein